MLVGEDFTGAGTGAFSDRVSKPEWQSTASACPAWTMEVLTFLGDGSPASGGELDLGGFDVDLDDYDFTFVIP
jgi:hypothetical protein